MGPINQPARQRGRSALDILNADRLVRERHRQMQAKIHRDTKADIRRYLKEGGFEIEEWLDDQYAVVVVKAVKT